VGLLHQQTKDLLPIGWEDGQVEEVCGAVCGMFMVKCYNHNRSIICRELLGQKGTAAGDVQEERTEGYY